MMLGMVPDAPWRSGIGEEQVEGSVEVEEPELSGSGSNAIHVANSLLRRAFRDGVPVTPMKLQKLLFFVACLYQRDTGMLLLTEPFQPWKYGPVCASVHDVFRAFGGRPITRYARDAVGVAYCVNEDSSPSLRKALNLVWENMKMISAVDLSRAAIRPGSAWSKAVDSGREYVSNVDMARDRTFDDLLGL